MAHLYLTRLNEENLRIRTGIPKGLWENQGAGLLSAISDNIIIDENAKTRGVSSIPDVWARPLLFQSALKDNSQHPMRQRLWQEWKGLMSLLALHKVKNYPLKIVSVKLGDENDRFSASLKRLKPKGIRLEQNLVYEWDKPLFVILFDNIPLGALSPATLVYTATDYKAVSKCDVKPILDDNHFLRPPTANDTPEDLEAVGKWAQSTFENIKISLYAENDNPDRGQVGIILNLFEKWIREIKESLSIRGDIDSAHVTVSERISEAVETGTLLDNYRTYRALFYPLVYKEGVETLTDFALLQTRKSDKTVIVIAEEMLSGNPRIWGGIRLKDLGESPKACIEKHFKEACGDEINRTKIENAIWIRPEKYFLTDTLLTAKEGNLLSQSELDLNINGRFIYPFSPAILDYYEPEDIKKLNPTFEQDAKGNVTFSFELKVRRGVREESLRVRRQYRVNNPAGGEGIIQKIDEPPVLEVFPNYISKYWRTYYLFHSLRNEFRITSKHPSKDVKFDERVRDVYERIKENNTHRDVKIGEVRIVEMQATGHNSSHAFPEALVVESAQGEKPLGLILLSRNQDRRFANKVIVGIDFGTSNTNVHLKKSDDETSEALEISFDKYLRSVTNSKEREKLLRRELKPPASVAFPVPTLLRIPDRAHIGKLNLDYGIYIAANNEFELPDSVYANIKFENKDYMSLFFNDLLFIIFIKLVEKQSQEVELRISYPKAFSNDEKIELQGRWVEVFREALFGELRFFDIRITEADNPEKMKISWLGEVRDDEGLGRRNIFFETEGVAIGEFFAKHDPAVANLAICLDVGGGTTDISIWCDRKIVMDASVLLAGRQISEFIRNRRRLQEILFSGEAVRALSEKEKSPIEFAARLNNILRTEEKLIRTRLQSNANNPQIRLLRQFLAIEFGAIAFYTGILCASNQAVAQRIMDTGVSLYWGGNAAKFVTWIDFGESNANSISARILNVLFRNSFMYLTNHETKNNAMFQQRQSNAYKSEVAGGLSVINHIPQADIQQIDIAEDDVILMGSSVVCGECIILEHEGGRQVNERDEIEEGMIFDRNNRTTFYRSSERKMIKYFIEVLQKVGTNVGLFEQNFEPVLKQVLDNKDDIDARVRGELIDRAARRNYVIEPIFIMEARHLLEKITKGN